MTKQLTYDTTIPPFLEGRLLEEVADSPAWWRVKLGQAQTVRAWLVLKGFPKDMRDQNGDVFRKSIEGDYIGEHVMLGARSETYDKHRMKYALINIVSYNRDTSKP